MLVSALSALFGALIGASAVAWVAWYQISQQRLQMQEQRLFEAKRAAFEAGLRLFNCIATNRWNGVLLRPGTKESEKYEDYDTMGRLGLYASAELWKEMNDLLVSFQQPLPKDEKQTEYEKQKIKSQRTKTVILMRKELGAPDLSIGE